MSLTAYSTILPQKCEKVVVISTYEIHGEDTGIVDQWKTEMRCIFGWSNPRFVLDMNRISASIYLLDALVELQKYAEENEKTLILCNIPTNQRWIYGKEESQRFLITDGIEQAKTMEV